MMPPVPEEAMTSSVELWRLFLTRLEDGRWFSRKSHVGVSNNNNGASGSGTSSFDDKSSWHNNSGGVWRETEQKDKEHSDDTRSQSVARERLELVARFLTPIRYALAPLTMSTAIHLNLMEHVCASFKRKQNSFFGH